MGAIFGKIYTQEPELGQLIGVEYVGTNNTNISANFWATDGVAALGIPGVLFISLLMAFFLRSLQKSTSKLDQRAVAVFLTGFWLAILNSSLFTSLLSGGGILIYFLLKRFGNKSL